MADAASQGGERVRAAEVIAALSLATDLGIGVPLQRMLGGAETAARVVRKRAGGAFDPAVAIPLADAAAELLALDADAPAWEGTLACEPGPWLTLERLVAPARLRPQPGLPGLVSSHAAAGAVSTSSTMDRRRSAVLTGVPQLARRRRRAILGSVAVPGSTNPRRKLVLDLVPLGQGW